MSATLAIGGTVGAVRLTSRADAGPPSAARTSAGVPATPGAPVTASPTALPTPDRPTATSPARASRGRARSAVPSPTATRSATAGRVVRSGSCGASFYDEGQLTANGETFDPEALTAAHKTWAFDSRVRVTNPATGKSVVVRINDRGPYVAGRCIDLSRAAFRAIAPLSQGEIDVRYEVLGSSGS